MDERVRQLQGLRGISFSKDERESALAFLAGQQMPDGMSKGSMQGLADELLTVLRLQQPPGTALIALSRGYARDQDKKSPIEWLTYRQQKSRNRSMSGVIRENHDNSESTTPCAQSQRMLHCHPTEVWVVLVCRGPVAE